MKRTLKTRLGDIDYSKTNFIWVYDHYDHHLSGLCEYNNKRCWFRFEYDTYPFSDPLIGEVFALDDITVIRCMAAKAADEQFNNGRWSYDGPLANVENYYHGLALVNKIIFKYYYLRSRSGWMKINRRS